MDLWQKQGIGQRHCGEDSSNVGNDKSLGFFTVIGIFYFLVLGLIVSSVFLVIELVVATMRDDNNRDISFPCRLKKRLQLTLAGIKAEWYSALALKRRKRMINSIPNGHVNSTKDQNNIYNQTPI